MVFIEISQPSFQAKQFALKFIYCPSAGKASLPEKLSCKY